MSEGNYVALDEQEQARGRSSTAAHVAWRALRAHQLWSKREAEGPLYPWGMKRDDPGGEEIWRTWWNDQLRLCDEAQRLTDEALATIPDLDHMAFGGNGQPAFAAALAAEREECAKVAEEISPLTAGKVIAAAIRARGQK